MNEQISPDRPVIRQALEGGCGLWRSVFDAELAPVGSADADGQPAKRARRRRRDI
jgi:hypothetical protein